MALQEKLDRFKKQQEKCQSTLTSIAASNKATTHKSMPVPAAPSVTRAPAPVVKFSNDTERLQHINSIRKAPVGAQMKRVINLLLEVCTQLSYPSLICICSLMQLFVLPFDLKCWMLLMDGVYCWLELGKIQILMCLILCSCQVNVNLEKSEMV